MRSFIKEPNVLYYMGKFPYELIQRSSLVRKEAASKFGIKPEERKTEELISYGIVVINKPRGPTSHQTAEYVKKILGIEKSGHSGTLDPHVTGMLPVALGRGTRIAQALLPAGKEYIAVMYLHQPVHEDDIRKVMSEFVRKIWQKPPVKSAVRRVERQREIYYIDIMEIEGQDVLFRVGCEAGTYIRKLIHDIGQKLGCGAHMAELIRTRVAAFDESTMFTLQDLADAFSYYKQGNDKFIRKIIQPVENAVRHLPKVYVFEATIESLLHGRYLGVPGISKVESGINKNDLVAMMTLKGELIGLGYAVMTSEEMVKKDNGIAVKTDKVFMKA